jgi:fumarylacetoacetate (FAA) hydrolase
MKLATLAKGGRDGTLAIVSRDLTRAVVARDAVAGLLTMQQLLDDWDEHELAVKRAAAELEQAVEGTRAPPFPIFPFDPAQCASPLPRAYQFLDGSAYVNHVELLRKSRGAEMPASFWTDPLMYQGCSDAFLAPTEPIRLADEAWGIDLEGEVAVVTGDVPMGTPADRALEHVRLLMLCNDVSLRNVIPPELAKGFGFVHGKPPSAFSPVAVSPDELGGAWRAGKVHLPYLAFVDGAPLGRPDAGVDMTFSFADLIAHAAKTRRLSAGTIIGSGTVSNKLEGGPGKPVAAGGAGYTCIAEVRTVETILAGKPSTPYLRFGSRVRLEMRDGEGRSVFGAIEQVVADPAG